MIGYRSVFANDMHWRDNQGGLFPLSPPFMISELEESEARKTMKDQGALFIRWESEFDQIKQGAWWHIIKDGACSLSDLSSNTRSKVRRGMKTFRCEAASRDTVLAHGYQVYCSAFSRYETHEARYSAEAFREAVLALPEQTEFWGVWNEATGDMVAFSENFVESDVCFYNTIWFEPSALKKYSSYALFYEMNRHYLEDRGFRYVSDGARSLSHETQIHDFLESKFGFRKAYARLNVIYKPWLGVLVKVAYPFRERIGNVPLGPFKKASVLLKQEEIRRLCEEGAL
ncbi:hypothetical protein [Marinobacter sp.]|uniref:hypothetical protein n=1 Tax=Marinobacter sp. TaxID=50741 RepID=UPI00356603DE